MATFTKIPDTETPVISINALNKISKINDNVYGGFTEYAMVYTKLFHILLLIPQPGTWVVASMEESTTQETDSRTSTDSAKMSLRQCRNSIVQLFDTRVETLSLLTTGWMALDPRKRDHAGMPL